MANPTSGSFGFRPVRHLSGAPWNGQTIRCRIAPAYGTALFIGDPILWTTVLTGKDATAKHPTIIISAGTDGTIIRGVITSFEPNPDNLTLQYSPAATAGWANVCLGLDVVFQVRDDGSGTPAVVFQGQNAEAAAGSGGSTVTGLSSYVLDASTPTTTQTFPLHILGLSDIPDNELADYAIWDVLLNTSENATGKYAGITASG